MADEKNELEEMAEFEAKTPATASRKDLWLFLIIIDVVFLCVFGFFLYKNLSAHLLSDGAEPSAAEEPAAVTVEEITSIAVEPVEVVPAPAVKPAAEPKEVAKEAPAAEVKKSEPKEEKPAPKTAAKKESVSIKTNPKSNYRQVTFKYFDDAKSVAVVSGFTMAKPRAMTKKNGVWETTLAISPGTYKYLYVVDGKQITEPYAEEQDGRSVLVVK